VEPTRNPKPSAPPLSPRRGLLMGIDRFEIQSHSHDAGPRRTALRAMGVLGVAGLVSRLGVSSGEAKSKKKGGKRKNRAKTSPACPTTPVPETCPGTCNSGCAQCFTRLGASPLCGHSAAPDCARGCSSDRDCVGSNRPYCVTHYYRRADEQTSNVCPSPGGWCTTVVDCIF
jgi:hypothetical protein